MRTGHMSGWLGCSSNNAIKGNRDIKQDGEGMYHMRTGDMSGWVHSNNAVEENGDIK